MDKEHIIFEISYASLLRLALVFLGILFLWQIRDILILLFIVLVIVAALSPIIDAWSKHMNRILAITLLYISLILVITALGLIVFPPLIVQLQELSRTLPIYIDRILPSISNVRELINMSQQGLTDIAQQLSTLTSSIFTATLGFFSGLIALVTIIVLSFYLLLEEHGTKKFVLDYLPLENREQVVLIAQKIGRKMGGWLRGQLLLGLIIGIIDGIGLSLLGVDYALTLGVWAGATEIIPYVGPILGAIPGVILAFSKSPLLGVLALAFYVIVQQIEGNVLVPKVMQKTVGLSPVIIIIALLIGAKLDGLLGIVLSIPAAAAIGVLFSEWPQIKQIYLRTKKGQT